MLVERVSESRVSDEDCGDMEKKYGRKVGVNLDGVGKLPEMRLVGDENVAGARFKRYGLGGGWCGYWSRDVWGGRRMM